MLFLRTINIFKCMKPACDCTQVREMSRVKTRFTKPPFWQPKKTRVGYPESVTADNQEFIREHVKDRYDSPLKAEIFERGEWEPNSYRCGLIAKKIGVLPFWLKNGKRVSSTLLHVSDNHVIKYIPPEELVENDFHYKRRVQKKERALGALVVGTDSANPTQCTKEYFKLFEEAGVMPKKKLTKFFITPNAKLPPGLPLYAAHFRPGDRVDITGITVDHGFQGVMKRWGFKGGRASHGVTKSHRRPGNIGGGGGAKQRVWPGTKMPGHMGRQSRTFRGQRVVRVNTKYNVIWLLGRVTPGEIGNYVIMYDSLLPLYRRTEENKPLFPTYFFNEEELPENLFDEHIHDFRQPSITFPQDKK